MNTTDITIDDSLLDKHVDFTDRWIMSRFQNTIKSMEEMLDKFDVNGATKILYSYVWNDFCDWFIELSKNRMYSDDKEIKAAVLSRALNLFEEMLKLVHPFMPYISEEIWHLLKDRKNGESISVTDFPKFNPDLIDLEAEKEIDFVQNVVTGIRNIRGEMNLAPSKKISVFIKSEPLTENQIKYISSLAKVEKLEANIDIEKPKASASSVIKGAEIYVPLEGLIDLDIERERLSKEIKRLEGMMIGVAKKLENEKFVNNAPADVVAREREKKENWENSIAKLKSILSDLN